MISDRPYRQIVFSDVRGTIIDNEGGHSQQNCMAALDKIRHAGYHVTLITGDPGSVPMDIKIRFPDVVDRTKVEIWEYRGAFFIDDESDNLRAARRLGAYTCRAKDLPTLAEILR